MHREQSPLPSGRGALYGCIPIVLISPIVTTFVSGHDILIYLVIIYAFLFTLLVVFRNLCRSWSSWLDKIVLVKETEILAWYESKRYKGDDLSSEAKIAEHVKVPSLIKARKALVRQIETTKSRSRWCWGKDDVFVKRLADGFDYATWLLQKENPHAKLPEPYTSTWLVQLELVLKNQRQIARGLKEHSPFILYRYSKFDVSIESLNPPKSIPNDL